MVNYQSFIVVIWMVNSENGPVASFIYALAQILGWMWRIVPNGTDSSTVVTREPDIQTVTKRKTSRHVASTCKQHRTSESVGL